MQHTTMTILKRLSYSGTEIDVDYVTTEDSQEGRRVRGRGGFWKTRGRASDRVASDLCYG